MSGGNQALLITAIGAVILIGAFWKAVPSAAGFVLAMARVPFMLQAILHEFAPNSGDSMRDKINELTTDTSHLRDTNHDLVNKMTASLGFYQVLADKVDQHTKDDQAAFVDAHEAQTQILDRLDKIEAAVEMNRVVAEQVRQDLVQFNEIDALGREGRIDRRRELAAQTAELQRQLAGIEGEQARVAADLAAMQARADAIVGGAPGEASDAGMQSGPDPESK